jgi:hypothetical protein
LEEGAAVEEVGFEIIDLDHDAESEGGVED